MTWKRILPVLFILLLAFFLRVYALDEIPPGLTHDEANHGREAIGILGGELAFFFPLNYGSEPLYSYTAALVMGLGGRNVLALRLVNAFFGVLTVAGAYLWSRLVFSHRLGLLAATLLAISFWPVAASREALRAGMMPFFTVGAMIFFWLLLDARRGAQADAAEAPASLRHPRLLGYTLGFALCLIATLYNYLAARVFWLVFPLFLVYLALFRRRLFRRSWPPTLAALLLLGISVIPIAWYLERYPVAQTRLDMLDSVFQQMLQGNFALIARNAGQALLAFVWPGYGDQFLAYNIPGRPVFEIFTAVLFLVGVAVCLWRWRRPAYFLLLLWFLVGIIPSLITGPTANTTRNVGAYVPAFIIPALAFVALSDALQARRDKALRPAAAVLAALWLFFVLTNTIVDYFLRWGQAADVRAAYQHTLVEALTYLEVGSAEQTTVVSSVYPGPAHDPSIGLLLAGADKSFRWVDARSALVLAGDEPTLLAAMASAPVHPAFSDLVELLEQRTLRPDDLDPGFSIYQIALPADWIPLQEPVTFGSSGPAMQLVGYRWLSDTPVEPGGHAELLQVWRVLEPAGVGPITPPSDTTDVVLFTHVLRDDGTILTQQDRLDAPSWDWQTGDYLLQVHSLAVPPDTEPGSYQVIAGIYDRASGERLPVWDSQAASAETRAFLLPLEIGGP
jgi:4-amino-4-deoxy-L-arabinose transferase-like glycosyltransferase